MKPIGLPAVVAIIAVVAITSAGVTWALSNGHQPPPNQPTTTFAPIASTPTTSTPTASPSPTAGPIAVSAQPPPPTLTASTPPTTAAVVPIAVPSSETSTPATPLPRPMDGVRTKGSRFNCTATGHVDGRGTKEGWMMVQGGAHFQYFSELTWQAEVLENDGHLLVEKRLFTTAKQSCLISANHITVTDTGHQVIRGVGSMLAALGGAGNPELLTASGMVFTADKLLQGNLAQKAAAIPGAGPWFTRTLNDMAAKTPEHRDIRAMLRTLTRIEGNTVTLTWRDGRLASAIWTDNTKIMTAEDRDYVARFAGYADEKLLPGDLAVKEKRTISAKDIADLLAIDYDGNPEALSGTVVVTRFDDRVPGQVAALSGNGYVSVAGERQKADVTVSDVAFDVVYGTTQGVPNRYLARCAMSGKATYAKLPESHPLFGVSMTVEPTVTMEYTAELAK